MNISFFIFSLKGGGAERITSHLANHWSSQAHHVSVITMTGEDDETYPLSKDISLLRFNLDRTSTGIFSAIKNNLIRVKTLRTTIKNTQPDILISMMPEANVTAAIACIHLNTRCIGSERAYPPFDPIGKFWTILRKYTYRLLDTVVAQTQQSENWIKKNTNAANTVVIPNPVVLPLPSFEPKISPRKRSDRKMILSAGRLTQVKQFSHLIKAFSLIEEKHPQYDLTILGDGEERSSLESLIDRLGLADRILLPGRAGNIGDWFTESDMYILTSKSEGFPNALLEAMSHNLPCISYDCPTGPGEIIQHEHNGILVPADDIDELSVQISRLIIDTKLHQLISLNAALVREKYSLDTVMDIWGQLIGDSS